MGIYRCDFNFSDADNADDADFKSCAIIPNEKKESASSALSASEKLLIRRREPTVSEAKLCRGATPLNYHLIHLFPDMSYIGVQQKA